MRSSLSKKQIINNFLVALLAQGIAFFLSAITSLVVPKLLGIEEFGFWQLFLLYCSYVGLAGLGISEGIYLANGGKRRGELDLQVLGQQYKFLVLLQCAAAVIVILFAVLCNMPNRSFVLICTAVYLAIVNSSTFFYYIFQAVNETKKYSTAIIVDKLAFLFFLVGLLYMEVRTFEPYVIAYLFAKCASLGYCLIIGHRLIRKVDSRVLKCAPAAWESIKVGSKLLLANLTGTLAIGVARMVVDAAWGIETFGQLSLSFTMCGFFLQCVYQLSMVLFPALRRLDGSKQAQFYRSAQVILDSVLPVIFLAYFPVVFLVEAWLPDYKNSLVYFAMLIPICIFDGRMDILGNTMLKVVRKETFLFIVNTGSVIAGGASSLICAYVFDSLDALLLTLVCVLFLRCFVAELFLIRQIKAGQLLRSWFSLLPTVVFLWSISCCSQVVSFLLTLSACATCFAANAHRIKEATKILTS